MVLATSSNVHTEFQFSSDSLFPAASPFDFVALRRPSRSRATGHKQSRRGPRRRRDRDAYGAGAPSTIVI